MGLTKFISLKLAITSKELGHLSTPLKTTFTQFWGGGIKAGLRAWSEKVENNLKSSFAEQLNFEGFFLLVAL